MRQAENTGPGPVSVPEEQGRSPIKVGAVVLAVVLAAWGLLWLTTKPEQPRGPGADSASGGITLTSSEAADRARELIDLSEEAIEKRNPSLLSRAYTLNSPAAARVRKDIRQLRRDGVIDKGQVEILSLEVVTSTSSVIQVRETSILRPCYVTDSGKDITEGPAAIEVVGLWTFHWQRDNWFIYDTSLERDRALDKKDASCA